MTLHNVVPRNWNDELRSCVLCIPADEDRSRLIRAIQDELFDWKSKDYKNLGELEDGIWWQGRNAAIQEVLTACTELKNSHAGDSSYMEGYQNAIFDVVSALKRQNLKSQHG